MTVIKNNTSAMVTALALLWPTMLLAQSPVAGESMPVTVKSFARAESNLYAGNVVKLGGLGKFFHFRSPTPIEEQTIVRMNRDTLYCGAVFDLDAGPITITLPNPGERFMSLQIINEDHYSPATLYGPSTVTLDRETVGTRYAVVAVRTFTDADSEDDIRVTNRLQDQINVEQVGGPGVFEVPNWDRLTQVKSANIWPICNPWVAASVG